MPKTRRFECRHVLFSAVAFLACVTAEAQPVVQVGYGTAAADPGSIVPVSTALFSYTNAEGVLVSQAAVAGMRPIRSGQIFIDETGARTGFVLVNPSAGLATITLMLRDASGALAQQRQLTLASGQHFSRYVNQAFDSLPRDFVGSMGFDSDVALGSITLRESVNRYGEPVYATMPTLDRGSAQGQGTVVFPHVAVGNGYTTQLLLMNPGPQAVRGEVRFIRSDGQPLLVRFNGQSASQTVYSLNANAVYRLEVTGDSLNTGYAVVTPDGGGAPAGTAVFQYKPADRLTSEAAAPSTPATANARIFVDQVGSRTGVALVNPGPGVAGIQLNLMDTAGNIEATRTLTLASGNHTSIFVDELFTSMPAEYTGLLEIRSSLPIVPITLRITTNSRRDPILATLPIADPSQLAAAPLVFPHIAIGSGFSTRLIMIHPGSSVSGNITLSFFNSDATPMTIPISGQTQNRFRYAFAPGAVRQLFAGLPGTAARVVLIDPATNQISNEVTIHEGHTVRPQIRVIDSLGRLRDDFEVTIRSLDSDVAEVTGSRIRGKQAGFSTITMTADRAIASATATVVALDSAVAGFETTGVALDLSQRLYLTAPQEHTVLVAQTLRTAPAVYAGTPSNPGFKDDLRLQALFRNPAFLALNQADGSLYVSDSANHAIRRIIPGPSGRAEMLAGNGTAGNNDGPARTASFNNPQGIALDHRGRLWVADSANHLIRRIRLLDGTVETVAGGRGLAGAIDGNGTDARFSFPTGIALEAESTLTQLARERSGGAPPPTSLLVADTGNGLIRRVTEDGTVSTVGSSISALRKPIDGKAPTKRLPADSSVRFQEPIGVAVDAAANIYVTESVSGQVRVVLRDGSTASASEPNSFVRPKAIVVTSTGSLVVADGSQAAKQIRHGAPRIASTTPDRVSFNGGETVTIRGSNFSPESLVIVSGSSISGAIVVNTQTITFRMPPLSSGTTTLTVQNRGGIAQTPIAVVPPQLEALPPGYITTAVGGSTYIGDGGPATAAVVPVPSSVALDSAGNLYIADRLNFRVRKVSFETGVITTVAGSGVSGYSGDGGPGPAAMLGQPMGIAVDSLGNVLIADTANHRIRRLEAATGVIRTIAGTGTGRGQCGGTFSGDGGPAIDAGLNSPFGIALDGRGNMFITDECNSRIRRVDALTGVITTFAGNGNRGFSGDGGPATLASLDSKGGIAIDPRGNLVIADFGNQRVRSVESTTGVITTVAGNGNLTSAGDGSPAVRASLAFPEAVAFDGSGNMLIVESGNRFRGGNRIRKVSAGTQIITTLAGTGSYGYAGDGRAPTAAQLAAPGSLVVDAAGDILLADTENNRVRRITESVITTAAGNGEIVFTGDGGLASVAGLCLPEGIAIDARDNIYVSHWCRGRVRRIDRGTGVITTLAGNDTFAFAGDNGPATAASFRGPKGLAVDSSGNAYIADSFNNRVRRVDARSGMITTVAGIGPSVVEGSPGFSGDGGPATAAMLYQPLDVALDRIGNLFIADTGNQRIRRVDARTGIISTVASSLSLLSHIAVDPDGNVLFVESSRIGKIVVSTGQVTTFFSDVLPIGGLAVDAQGNVFFGRPSIFQVARLDARTGNMAVAARFTPLPRNAPLGDGGPASAAFVWPFQIAVDSRGNLFIVDQDHSRVRAIRGPIP